MKDLKHIKRFNESEENLNISDVSESSLQLACDFAEWISLNNWSCKSYAQNHWDQNGKGNWKTTRDLFELYKNSH